MPCEKHIPGRHVNLALDVYIIQYDSLKTPQNRLGTHDIYTSKKKVLL